MSAAEAGRGAAVDRVTRTMALALGVGALVFGLLAVGGFLAQYSSFAPWWSWGVAISTFLPLIAAAVLSPVAPPRVLRILTGIAAIGHLAGLVLLVPALPGGHLAEDVGTPWLLTISTIGTSAAAVAWRPWVAWIYLVACVAGLGVDRLLASTHTESWMTFIALQDAVYTLLFDAIFTALAMATRRAGRALDRAADLAITETREAATTDARVRERSRIEALLHDSVLVALLASARGSDRAPDEARAALARLDAVAESPDAAPIDGESWLWRLQALTTDIAPAARFSHELAELPIPSAVADAVLEATAEAVRNSVRHAGPAARAVHARIAADGLEVTVLDDGVGFDPAAVGGARLGVAVSILDRMRAVPGGRAAVVSRPGVGTRVSIAWRAA